MFPADQEPPEVAQPGEAPLHLIPAAILLGARDNGAPQLGSPLHRASLDPNIALVSPPAGSQPRRICVFVQNSAQSVGPLMCSMDGGKTWSQRPHLEITYTSPNQGPTVAIAQEVAIGPDSTVYADMGPLPNTTTPDTLYLLAPGSERWQSLGTFPADVPTPASTYAMYATADLPGAGIFWNGASLEFQLFNP